MTSSFARARFRRAKMGVTALVATAIFSTSAHAGDTFLKVVTVRSLMTECDPYDSYCQSDNREQLLSEARSQCEAACGAEARKVAQEMIGSPRFEANDYIEGAVEMVVNMRVLCERYSAAQIAAMRREAAQRKADEAAARAKREAEAAAEAKRAAEAKALADKKRRQALDEGAAKTKATAARELAALEKLPAGAEQASKLGAWLRAYRSATVTEDGVTERVVVADVGRVFKVIADAKAEPGEPWQSPTLGTMQWIPAGTFAMGSARSEPGRDKDEKLHDVTLSKGFWMMEHEVTQGDFAEVMLAPDAARNFGTCGANCPAYQVNWDQVQEYIERVSVRDGVTYRLPTEAEWEYAARGGAEGMYPEEGELEDVAWFASNSGGSVHPVCTKRHNEFELCDMFGNAWEWVSDYYGPYPGRAVTDPTGPKKYKATGADKMFSVVMGIARGGAFDTGLSLQGGGGTWNPMRAAFRRGSQRNAGDTRAIQAHNYDAMMYGGLLWRETPFEGGFRLVRETESSDAE